MPKATVLVTQSGADTDTLVQVPLPDLDGKSGRSIFAMRVRWEDGAAVAAADYVARVVLQTDSATEQVPTDAEYIGEVSWGAQNTAGTAVLVTFDPVKQMIMPEARVSVQDLYVCGASANTSQANDFYVDVFYDLVKLSEIEYLRLLAGGA